jgi:hypothetical protein
MVCEKGEINESMRGRWKIIAQQIIARHIARKFGIKSGEHAPWESNIRL